MRGNVPTWPIAGGVVTLNALPIAIILIQAGKTQHAE